MVYSNYYLGDLIGEIFSFLYDVIILDTPTRALIVKGF